MQLTPEQHRELLSAAAVKPDEELITLISLYYQLPIHVANRLVFMVSKLKKYEALKESIKSLRIGI
jgi:hypothetical protein